MAHNKVGVWGRKQVGIAQEFFPEAHPVVVVERERDGEADKVGQEQLLDNLTHLNLIDTTIISKNATKFIRSYQ
jgi:hypothetical protein